METELEELVTHLRTIGIGITKATKYASKFIEIAAEGMTKSDGPSASTLAKDSVGNDYLHPRDYPGWQVARRTLPVWTRNKLMEFNGHHLGPSNDWLHMSHQKLQQAAERVVEAELESSLLRRNDQLIHALSNAQPVPSVALPAPPLSIDAAAERVGEAFEAVDLNKDGMIDHEEFDEALDRGILEQTNRGRRLAEQSGMSDFHQVDLNGDGIVDHAEFVAAMREGILKAEPRRTSPSPEDERGMAAPPRLDGYTPSSTRSNGHNSSVTQQNNLQLKKAQGQWFSPRAKEAEDDHRMTRARSQTMLPQLRKQTSHFAKASSNISRNTGSVQVVFSYQTVNLDFVIRLRSWLNNRGIATVDGSQVPAGQDWRKFYFPRLRRAAILLPVLSPAFLFSRACESELTYGFDKGKTILPILFDPAYQPVLDNPENYIDKDGDIETRVPKLEMFLQQCNRIPANGSFDDEFESHASALLDRINDVLGKRDSESDSGTDGAECDMEDGIAQIVSYLRNKDLEEVKSEEQMNHHLEKIRQLNVACFQTEADLSSGKVDQKSCEKAIQAGPISMLVKHLEVLHFAEAAADVVRTLCEPGGLFGDGLLEFRRHASEQGVVNSLLSLMNSDEPVSKGSEWTRENSLLDSPEACDEGINISIEAKIKAVKHCAINTLLTITRSRAAKDLVAKNDGIPILIGMIKDPANTVQSKYWALNTIWNEVYANDHKKIMIENGIIEILINYVNDPKSVEKGHKCAYFVMSHLSYVYPEQVNASGIVDHALETIKRFSTQSVIPPGAGQTLESACRLMQTIAESPVTQQSLAQKRAVEILLNVFRVNQERNPTNLDDPIVAGAPMDAFKMRAAAALDSLAKVAPEAPEQVSQFMDANYADPDVLVWMAVQPVFREILEGKSQIMELMKARLGQCTYDLAILLIATASTPEALSAILKTKREGHGTVEDFLFEMFQSDRHTMCSRWAIFCQSLEQGGHPYKAAAANLLKEIVSEPDLEVRKVATSSIMTAPDKLGEEARTLLQRDQGSLVYLKDAIVALSKQ